MLIPIRDHNPSARRPYVTYALIVANIVVFIGYAGLFAQERALMHFFQNWGMLPARLGMGDGYATLLTHQFLHGDLVHLGSNLLFLWIFGNNMEDVWGHFRFLGFYLLCGVAAAGLQFAADPTSVIPMVGASGAIAGVLGGYLLFYPRARVDLFLFLIIIFRVIPAPAWVVLGGWFALQILGGVSAPAGVGGVAYWAHAGGFMAGVALSFPLWQRLGGRAFWSRCLGQPPHPEARYRFVASNVPKAGKPARFRPNPWRRR
ncbi:MAG: rhomboid family intramembrane serine protease [Rhodobacteraceae bacterium]|nr:rhomboid family intramembrane serine protease [Paracoccaceae bacterium]